MPENDSHGGPGDEVTTVGELRQLMREFVRQRNWEHFHNAKNLSMSLAIETAELMEHFQWKTSDEAAVLGELDLQGVREELADVVCYALSLANALNIDLASSIRLKMVKNRLKYPAPGPSS